MKSSGNTGARPESPEGRSTAGSRRRAAVMMDHEIDSAAEDIGNEIINISNYLFRHPELGDSEFAGSAFLTDLLAKSGFRVQYPYKGLKTAFRAEYGDPAGVKTAFLAEYDALPGYGPQKKPAHACGHNWIAASTVGAALILSRLKEPPGGCAVVIGTPAEETVGRKIDLLNAGAFDDIDAVFQMHLAEATSLDTSALAIDSWKFEFFGKASHAAASPFNGINALDAVNLTFAGINALRQQLRQDVRVHGIVSDGGETPNIIPGYASCKFYVRAADRAYLDEVSKKIRNCATGAALMTGARVRISQFENSFDDLRINPALRRLMRGNLIKCGIDDFSSEPELTGSTDIGNVSHRVPTFYGNIGVGNGKARTHEEAFLKFVDSAEAHGKLMKVAKAFAYSACELFRNPELLKEARAEFEKSGEPR